jgi:hypothetical protein
MDPRLFLATALLASTSAVTAIAQTAPSTRVRGTIATVEGNKMTVNSRDGQKLEVTLNDPLAVLTVKKVDLNSIAANTYVGVATRTGTDGKLTALEVAGFSRGEPRLGRGPLRLGPGTWRHDDQRHCERRSDGWVRPRAITYLQGRQQHHLRATVSASRDFRTGRAR